MRTVEIAHGSASIAANKTKIVRLKLDKSGLKLLKTVKKLKASVRVTFTTPGHPRKLAYARSVSYKGKVKGRPR